MPSVTDADLHQNLAAYLDEAVNSRTPIVVTRQGKGNVVLISAEEFEGWQETAYLLGNPANARRLLQSAQAARDGDTFERELVQPTAANGA